ncbi:MAG: DUF1801 domain-containing protein [Bacteroidetes bacterium]|nr:DUF1801 domain-containing protein [Bacteroidota bacterium]
MSFSVTPLDNFYIQQNESLKSCYLALRDIILSQHKQITPEWKYGCPFFYFKGKMFCYLWFHKKLKQPYIAIMKGKLIKDELLLAEGRKNIKIMLFDPNNDLPIKKINAILQKAIELY